jgi:hypothetical protein
MGGEGGADEGGGRTGRQGGIGGAQLADVRSLSSGFTANAVSVAPAPPPRHGWLKKRGQKIHSWKKRFFVVEGGTLRYIDIDIDIDIEIDIMNTRVSI